jgi:hypothetical protein
MTRQQASARAASSVDLRQSDAQGRAWEQAMDFIVSILGTAWLERELEAPKDKGYLLLGGDEDDDDDLCAYLRLQRVVLLASELDASQRIIRGSRHLVKALRARTSYEAVAELRAINHMARAGQAAWFIDPNANQGPSFDAVVVLSGHEVAVEVKAKESKPVAEYRPSLIENPLRKARSQLPPSGPSMVYLQIASPWSDDEGVLLSIDSTVKRMLDKSGRINAVVLMLERTYIRPDGNRSRASGQLTIPNLNPHVWVPDIQDWLRVAPDKPLR